MHVFIGKLKKETIPQDMPIKQLQNERQSKRSTVQEKHEKVLKQKKKNGELGEYIC